MSKNKILVSGCGFSFTEKNLITWPNCLRSLGYKVKDLTAPAISNTTILNRIILELSKKQYDHVIIQLSILGKLDVSIDESRITNLVKPDPIRNFTFGNIWPSSLSNHHISKKLYYEHLYSPTLESLDIICKLWLLKNVYKNITVFQAYEINWNDEIELVKDMFYNFGTYEDKIYKNSIFYNKHHNIENKAQPIYEFQLDLANRLIKHINLSKS